jgi:phosphate transport system permease protein
MTDIATDQGPGRGQGNTDRISATLARRNRSQRRLQAMGLTAMALAFLVLGILLWSLVVTGYRAVVQTHLTLEVFVDPAEISAERLPRGGFDDVLAAALFARFPEVEGRQQRRDLAAILSNGAQFQLIRA